MLRNISGLLDRARSGRRATVDTVGPPPLPLQPIDLTDDAEVTSVLRLAIRVGEVLLASGTGAIDTMIQVGQVAAAYGLTQCDIDVTFNSIAISARRGTTLPPAVAIRIVHYRSHDFTRLSTVDRLIRRIRRGSVTHEEALEELDALNTAPHPYPRWLATVCWAGMAASISILLGGHLVVMLVSFFATVAIDRTNRLLNRIGLPYFFQQVVGGFIASLPAVLLYMSDLDFRPALIIAAGMVVLLSGLSLVGSVQDAITGAPITASARFFEVVVMTGGIIAGVALSLHIASALGITVPGIAPSQFTGELALLPLKVFAGALASGFFALACYAEARAAVVAAVAGAVGSLVTILASSVGIGTVISIGMAATIVGFAGGLMARRAVTPPIVVGVAGITPLLPGLPLYRGLSFFLNGDPLGGLSNLVGGLAIGCALAAGVVLGEWGARALRRPRILNRAASLRRPIISRRVAE